MADPSSPAPIVLDEEAFKKASDAYDTVDGGGDSGCHDPSLRSAISAYISALPVQEQWQPIESAPTEIWEWAHMEGVAPRLGELVCRITVLSDGSRCVVEWGNPVGKPLRFYMLPKGRVDAN